MLIWFYRLPVVFLVFNVKVTHLVQASLLKMGTSRGLPSKFTRISSLKFMIWGKVLILNCCRRQLPILDALLFCQSSLDPVFRAIYMFVKSRYLGVFLSVCLSGIVRFRGGSRFF
jgi:hypothetical protein